MVYANHLREEGYKFMEDKLDYKTNKGKGRTRLLDGGGAYLAVHLRRGDYLYARKEDIPSINGAANQINKLLKHLKLNHVFVATDAGEEGNELNTCMRVRTHTHTHTHMHTRTHTHTHTHICTHAHTCTHTHIH